MTSPSNVVIVPDGLGFAAGRPLPRPSFVYRAVLDAALRRPPDDVLLLAPANHFGGNVTEEEAAERYLRAAGRGGAILRPPPAASGYIDTRGNAKALRLWLQTQQAWPLAHARLLVAQRHARRALLCFQKEGFVFEAVDRVSYAIPAGEGVVPRLWYYRWPLFHRLYEAGALLRERLGPSTVQG